LLGEGLEPSWVLGAPAPQKITLNKWIIFQQQFVDRWMEYVATHSCGDVFWKENHPAFHTYDYGTNIEIEVSEPLHSLVKETSLRRSNEGADSDSDSSSDTGHDHRDHRDHGTQRETGAAKHRPTVLPMLPIIMEMTSIMIT
jgi:hypothetical protein